jgi:vacuolar-type H+-ATPase subunit H
MTQQSKKRRSESAIEEGMTAEQAMNIVLEAERNARESVEQCKLEAEAILQQARQKSQRIGKRVDDRITRIHQRVARVVTDQVKKLDEEEQQLAKQQNQYRVEHDIVEIVVDRIAEMLTTPTEIMQRKEGGQSD